MAKTRFIICVLCTCVCFVVGSVIDEEHELVLQNEHDPQSPMVFPQKSDSSTPILIGSDPKMSHLPPKTFPNVSSEHNRTGPPILSGTEAHITEIKNNKQEQNMTHKHISSEKNSTVAEHESTASPKEDEKLPAEQDDMLHSKYKGGQDVDELLKPEKKATEKDEKKPTTPKKDPKSEVIVSAEFDKKGPKLMNETKTKTGDSMLESTSKMMAVSSSMLSSAQPMQHGIIDPAKTVVTILLSVVVIVCLGIIGLLVWKRIAMRRFGRDVLINEDDFDEVSDMHTFDRAQIQIT